MEKRPLGDRWEKEDPLTRRLLSRRELLRLGGTAVGGLALGGLLAGCSQPSQQPSSGAAAQPAAPAAKASTQVIKIGAPHPLTGPWAEPGNNSLNGITLAIEHINAQGGIKSMGGAKLDVVPGDAGNDPAQAASVTRRLIENDKVPVLIGSYLSSLTLTASTESEKAGIPMLSQSFVDTLTQRGYKYFFQLPGTASVIGSAASSYFKELMDAAGGNLKKAVVVGSNDASTKQQVESVAESVKKLGLDLQFVELYTPGLSDASAIVTKIRDAGAEMALLGGPTPDAILIVRTMRSVGLKIPVIGIGGGGWLTRGFGEALKEHSDGVFGTAAWSWDLPYEGIKQVNEEFKTRFKEPFMPQEAGEVYIATWLIKEGLEKVGSADPDKLRNFFAETTFDKGPGSWMPGGKVKFDANGLNEAFFPVMIEWKDGLLHTVWPKDVQAMKPFFG